MSMFCTCKDTACPLHPSNHDRGCTPCIRKNLQQHEIPSCFFNLIDPSVVADGKTKFSDFAHLVLQRETDGEPSAPADSSDRP